jgi:hypothetical protein
VLLYLGTSRERLECVTDVKSLVVVSSGEVEITASDDIVSSNWRGRLIDGVVVTS